MPSIFSYLQSFRAGGLLAVIVVLSGMLAWLGGSVTVKRPEVDAQGNRVFVEQTQNKFLNADTILTLMKEASFIAVMAVGATMVIILGGIDLSVASVYALSAILGALFLQQFGTYTLAGQEHVAWPFWLAGTAGIMCCLGTGLVCGLLNGLMVVAFRMHPFIITLGTMAIYRGIAFVITGGQSVTPLPPEMQGLIKLDMGPALGLRTGLYPVPLLLMLLTACIAAVFLSQTALGRAIFASGGNTEAARLTGLRVGKITVFVFAVAGLLAGLASVILLGYYGSASSNDGAGYELQVIAAAVVGGASLSGGRGSILGTMLGAILIKMIDLGIVILEVNQNYSQIIIGAVIIAAVGLDQISQRYGGRARRGPGQSKEVTGGLVS